MKREHRKITIIIKKIDSILYNDKERNESL